MVNTLQSLQNMTLGVSSYGSNKVKTHLIIDWQIVNSHLNKQ
jgi:hypothetical protein